MTEGTNDTRNEDRVSKECACPCCSEDRVDYLWWNGDVYVECSTCGAHYDPLEE